MKSRSKKYISLFIAALMVFALAGCSREMETAEGQAESQAEDQAESQVEEQTPEATETADFDIASNLQLAGGGDEKAIDTDCFTITLTHGSSWDYTVDSKTSITIYNVEAREADYGGRLVSIIAYDTDDKEYEVLPSYSVIGEKNGKVYIAEYPSDVQFDPSNEKAAADYQAVFEEVNRIREGAEDSPIVLK